MDKQYQEKTSHGVIRMQDYLTEKRCTVNQKRVRRLLRQMGVMAIYPKRSLSRLGEALYPHPYLPKGLTRHTRKNSNPSLSAKSLTIRAKKIEKPYKLLNL